jgi:hypothetical protein
MTDKEVTEDRRFPDQDTALEKAFVAGVLPEEDRRADSASEEEVPAVAVVPSPNDHLSGIREREDGVRVTAGDSILE